MEIPIDGVVIFSTIIGCCAGVYSPRSRIPKGRVEFFFDFVQLGALYIILFMFAAWLNQFDLGSRQAEDVLIAITLISSGLVAFRLSASFAARLVDASAGRWLALLLPIGLGTLIAIIFFFVRPKTGKHHLKVAEERIDALDRKAKKLVLVALVEKLKE